MAGRSLLPALRRLDRITPVKGGRAGLRRCGPCKREFTVTVGTIFERSHIKLHKWFQAAHLMASSKKGISAHARRLHRTLKVTYKTAWFMEHRLREAMRELNPPQLGGEGKTVEFDETYIGGREKNKHRNKRVPQGSGPKGAKEIAFSLVERGGNVRSHHIPTVNSHTLGPILREQIDRDSKVMTDEARTSGGFFRDHETVNHSIGEYVRGDVHTNTIEGYFSILKRGITGTYHHVSPQHLKRYLAEFDFRYDERQSLGVSDEARADKLVRGIIGKRLTYRNSSQPGTAEAE